MIEFLNVLIALIAGLVAGAAIHSAYLHSKNWGELTKIIKDEVSNNEDGEPGRAE